jgi:hypothetical protein
MKRLRPGILMMAAAVLSIAGGLATSAAAAERATKTFKDCEIYVQRWWLFRYVPFRRMLSACAICTETFISGSKIATKPTSHRCPPTAQQQKAAIAPCVDSALIHLRVTRRACVRRIGPLSMRQILAAATILAFALPKQSSDRARDPTIRIEICGC